MEGGSECRVAATSPNPQPLGRFGAGIFPFLRLENAVFVARRSALIIGFVSVVVLTLNASRRKKMADSSDNTPESPTARPDPDEGGWCYMDEENDLPPGRHIHRAPPKHDRRKVTS